MTGGPDHRVHRFRSADGRLDLFARDYPGEGPPLLLMHGLTRNSADFEPLARHLSGRYRLIVPDQRGRGNSDWDEQPANYRPDIYAGDMFALLDSLAISKAGLIGTSMGGLIAMVMAAIQPLRVASIILNDVGPHVEPEGLARIQAYVSEAPRFSGWAEAAERAAAINGQAFPDFGPSDWTDFARRTCREAADGSVQPAYDPAIGAAIANVEPQQTPPDLWPLWDMLSDKPVLVVRGARSDVLSADTIARMAQGHSGPFETMDVANRGHAPLLDEPEALAAIGRFLARHEA